MKKILLVLISIMFILAMSASASTGLVGNGSFEEPSVSSGTSEIYASIPGWAIECTAEGCNEPEVKVHNSTDFDPVCGDQYVELDAVKISQSLGTVGGDCYDLHFAWRASDAESKLIFYVDEIGELNEGGATGWVHGTYGFTAQSGGTTIAFAEETSKGQQSVFLDAVELVECSPVEDENIVVGIDIKPGSYPNSINPDGSGVIPVAVLGSAELDATDIDVNSLSFEGLAPRMKGNGDLQCSIEDVSGANMPDGEPDGYPDLVCQFENDMSVWTAEQTEAVAIGNLKDGTLFDGFDSIKIVP